MFEDFILLILSRFLLAILFFQSLHDKTTPKAVKKALDQLGKRSTAASEDQKLQVLRRAYDEAMVRIDGQLPDLRDLAKRVLSWITCARRPLVVEELRHALAVEFDEDSEELDEENLHDPGIVVSVCAGLVTVDDEIGIIRLVHYTTQEYFEQTRAHWFPDAHLDMARTCAKYLSYPEFASGRCGTAEEFADRLSRNPLYDYAAGQWGHHAREADTDCDEVMTFLQRDAQVDASGNGPKDYDYWRAERRAGQTIGLHLAANFGLDRALQRLLSLPGGHAPDIRGRKARTPLICAAMNGHQGAVELLLATGAVDATAYDRYKKFAPLHYAARGGHEGVVQALLATGAVDVNEWRLNGSLNSGPPLTLAAAAGHGGTVRMLLATGKVDVNGVDTWGRTALCAAADNGHEGIVRMLLAVDEVDINADGIEGRVDTDGSQSIVGIGGYTPLFCAVRGGHEGIVQILLARGDVDCEKPASEETPLLAAAESGYESIVRRLLATGAVDVNARDRYQATPITYAAKYGYEAIARMLLATGQVDLEAECENLSKDDEYDAGSGTPLRVALRFRQTAIAQLLRDHGAEEPQPLWPGRPHDWVIICEEEEQRRWL